MLAVVDAEDASLTPLVKCIHLSSHCLRQCPRLGSIEKDWQDIHKVEANLGRHRDAGAPDVAIQRGHAIPHNCYPSYQLCFTSSISVNQASKIGERVHHVCHKCESCQSLVLRITGRDHELTSSGAAFFLETVACSIKKSFIN